jgi:hypothetical protein
LLPSQWDIAGLLSEGLSVEVFSRGVLCLKAFDTIPRHAMRSGRSKSGSAVAITVKTIHGDNLVLNF